MFNVFNLDTEEATSLADPRIAAPAVQRETRRVAGGHTYSSIARGLSPPRAAIHTMHGRRASAFQIGGLLEFLCSEGKMKTGLLDLPNFGISMLLFVHTFLCPEYGLHSDISKVVRGKMAISSSKNF